MLPEVIVGERAGMVRAVWLGSDDMLLIPWGAPKACVAARQGRRRCFAAVKRFLSVTSCCVASDKAIARVPCRVAMLACLFMDTTETRRRAVITSGLSAL